MIARPKNVVDSAAKPTTAKSEPVGQMSTARVSFIMETHIGLQTTAENLRRFVDRDDRIEAQWFPVVYEPQGELFDRVPLIPEGLRGMLRGRHEVRSAIERSSADVCLYSTQVPAAIGGRRVRSVPYVIMVDDTPRLFDGMAEQYDVRPDRFLPLKWLKHKINVAALRRAHLVLPNSRWARASLVDDYGVDPDRVVIAPLGVDLATWMPGEIRPPARPLQVLFVGGHFERKGGDVLLDAFDALPPGTVELRIVTRAHVDSREGVSVYRGLAPNSPELVHLYQTSDLLVLPSRADMLPFVIAEGLACGLPAVVSDVGALPEMVVEGRTGHVVPSGDTHALRMVLESLAGDVARVRSMGVAARTFAVENYDGAANARRIVDHVLSAAHSGLQNTASR